MAVHYRTKGFIFKEENRGDADKIFSVFTYDYGRIDVVGKAIRKIASKLRGGMEIYSLSEIEFIQGKAFKTLTDAQILEKFPGIKTDVKKYDIARCISFVLDALLKGEEADIKTWELLGKAFREINAYDDEMIYYFYLWKLFSALGYEPDVFNCVKCGSQLKPGKLFFSYRDSAVLCSSCIFPGQKNCTEVDADMIKILRLIFSWDWNAFSKIKIENSSKDVFKNFSEDYQRFFLSSFTFQNI